MKDYNLITVSKSKTDRGSTCYYIEAESLKTGEIIEAVYFGNTVPKEIVSITDYTTKEGTTYKIAEIQPHQSRNKLGRFISAHR